MNKKLSEKLAERGAVRVSGTAEFSGGKEHPVESGRPLTVGGNNGLRCFYDENGDPWVIRVSEMNHREVEEIVGEHNLSFGPPTVYVPHSNDGGHFMSRLPAMLEMQRTECPKIRLRLEEYARLKLGPLAAGEVDGHLLECDVCADDLSRIITRMVESGELPQLESPGLPCPQPSDKDQK